MLERIPLADGEPSPWSMETAPLQDDAGWAVRIVGEHATELAHARQVHLLARKAMERLQVDESLVFRGELTISELATNAILYGGRLDEVDIVWSRETSVREEILDIGVINPATSIEGTPGTNHRGQLAAKEANHEAVHGRGLQIIDELADHQWGQVNDSDTQTFITYTILQKPSPAGLLLDGLDEAA